jgi:hypothetical protein
MANRKQLFEFVIDAFTPDTLPMGRLAEYLADLAALLGEKDRVHFIQVGEGSARLAYAVEEVALPTVRHRVAGARIADSESDERRAFESIDHRLREDKATAELRETDQPEGKVLFFPGRTRDVDPAYGPFNQQGQLYGTVIQVGGKRSIVNVNIQDGELVYYCEASRDLALQLAPLMFNYTVRVHGTGRYFRNPDGQWEMKNFKISDFEKLERRPLAETVERLRSITRKVGLDKDILTKLADLRREPSEA